MFGAFFYKEWIKTRRSVLLAAALMTAAVVYSFLNVGQEFRVFGAVAAWNNVITKDTSLLPTIMQWLPAVVGVLVAVSQFVPEMTDKRLKLTLHLPLGENRIVCALLTYGVAVTGALFVVTNIALVAGMSVYYPGAIVAGMFLRSLPWFLCGVFAYLVTAWVVLEPLWRQKILNGLAGACLCYFFLIGAPSGAYVRFLPWLIVLTIVGFSFPFYSAARFKQGVQ
ncbi:MAG: hypothetical protein LIO85_09775 [Rikenellaceae bacterium]|nr:hypothetical protein [Rikenellaceae bacterium]